tara:strand:+ start:6846 stop:9953 length:3108 start_codon:yes stop_codon:yes gene_type:complete
MQSPTENTATAKWQTTVERVSKAVVVIKTTGTRAFDTESASSAYATGFVVDKERGIILTNRHVLRPGPVIAEAVFQNREEVSLKALYADPVHDFAFFRFDPNDISFHDVTEVVLNPTGAKVGLDVKIIGNDSGEKLSILSATLARLDRDAPKYGSKTYNDFNTFYVQAASGTKGGSSGSPVVNVDGVAVALNAGSKNKGASAYYLPLFRVQRALELLRDACPAGDDGVLDVSAPLWHLPNVPRGTLQATFCYKGFDDLRRMGLPLETEKLLREAQVEEGGTGALVVEDTTPGGPCENAGVQVGDVLIGFDSFGVVYVTNFVKLERILDDNVGEEITLNLSRAGEMVKITLTPDDLHKITPSKFLEINGGVVHALSYQQGRNFQMEAGQVYVAEPGYVLGLAGVPKHAIIKELDNTQTPDLDSFAKVYARLVRKFNSSKDGDSSTKTNLKYFTKDERHRVKTATIRAHFNWHVSPTFFERDWRSGMWGKMGLLDVVAEDGAEDADAMDVTNSDKTEKTKRRRVAEETKEVTQENNRAENNSNNTSLSERVAQTVEPSLCIAKCDIASVALADGVYSRSFEGNGLVLHHDLKNNIGIVVVDRNTVPISSCDVLLTFAAYPCEVAANVEFLHPTKNFALVSYRVDALPEVARGCIKPAVVRNAATTGSTVTHTTHNTPIRRGDELVIVGLNNHCRPQSRKVSIADAATSAAVPSADIPRFRAVNEETLKLDIDLGFEYGGVLGDSDGVIKALWASYATPASDGEVDGVVRGMFIDSAVDAAQRVLTWMESKEEKQHEITVLDVEFEVITLSKAANLNVPQTWIDALLKKDPERRQALVVASTVAGTNASKILQDGDVVLQAAGQTCVTFSDVDQAVDAVGEEKLLPVTVCRGGEIHELSVELSAVSCVGTDRLIHWAGCIVQKAHRPVAELGFTPTVDRDGEEIPYEVFISRWFHGSPAHRYGLYALHWIVEVNDQPTVTIDDFTEVVTRVENNTFVRIKLVSLQGRPKVLTVKVDHHYWPTWELRKSLKKGWERVLL